MPVFEAFSLSPGHQTAGFQLSRRTHAAHIPLIIGKVCNDVREEALPFVPPGHPPVVANRPSFRCFKSSSLELELAHPRREPLDLSKTNDSVGICGVSVWAWRALSTPLPQLAQPAYPARPSEINSRNLPRASCRASILVTWLTEKSPQVETTLKHDIESICHEGSTLSAFLQPSAHAERSEGSR